MFILYRFLHRDTFSGASYSLGGGRNTLTVQQTFPDRRYLVYLTPRRRNMLLRGWNVCAGYEMEATHFVRRVRDISAKQKYFTSIPRT